MMLRFATESLNNQIKHEEDNSNIGEIYTSQLIRTSVMSSGTIEGKAHGDTIGNLMFGILGGESAVTDPFDALLVASYNGTALYQRFTKTGTSILSEDSPDGSAWAADTNFGIAGTLDISLTGNDTFGELETVISAFTGYDAKLFGNSSAASSNIADFTATQTFTNDENAGAMLWQSGNSGASASKTHTLSPAAVGVCLPSWNFLIDRVLGTNKSLAFTGSKFNSLTISVDAEGLVNVSIDVDSAAELIDQMLWIVPH